jgi:hypothetical protein
MLLHSTPCIHVTLLPLPKGHHCTEPRHFLLGSACDYEPVLHMIIMPLYRISGARRTRSGVPIGFYPQRLGCPVLPYYCTHSDHRCAVLYIFLDRSCNRVILRLVAPEALSSLE